MITNTTLARVLRRQDLINQYIDCHEEVGGEDSDGLRICLNCLSDSELVKYCQESGWDIN